FIMGDELRLNFNRSHRKVQFPARRLPEHRRSPAKPTSPEP
ncbi:hypothetical protein A2U01_0108778, partial [Trifolium medium]|nr:hypothetical protein [Trifolium medium]